MSFPDKVYQGACIVCGAATQMVTGFLSTMYMCNRVPHDGICYPAIPCKGKHTLRELRAALRLPLGAKEDPDRIVGSERGTIKNESNLPIGHVYETLGGIIRAYSNRIGIGYGPFGSVAEAEAWVKDQKPAPNYSRR